MADIISMQEIYKFFSEYLIYFMGGCLSIGLVFRFAAFRASKNDNAYYSSFTRELELNVEKDKEDKKRVGDIDKYLSEVLGRVSKRLPQRSVRFGGNEPKEEASDEKKAVSLRDYVSGKQGLVTNIQSESTVFHNETPPNFTELTHRIMSQDPNWTKVMKHFPIDGVSRMIDILPGIFIVLGVFGTFMGISLALPEIAQINFDDLKASEQTINAFVLNVTYAMETSIAGIFFSLLLTVLNTLFPIKERRARVFKKVETALQMLWYHIQKDVNADQDEKVVFKKLLDVLENIDRKMNDGDESIKKAS